MMISHFLVIAVASFCAGVGAGTLICWRTAWRMHEHATEAPRLPSGKNNAVAVEAQRWIAEQILQYDY